MAVSKRLRFEVLKRDNHTCRYCGDKAPDVKLTVDHVVPVALGGGDVPENLAACCEGCNSGKSSMAPDSPLVAAVADDALRWARAMEVVAQQRAAERKEAKGRYRKFQAAWKAWYSTDWRGNKIYVDLPGAWERSVDQFLDAGLDMDDLVDLIRVAMGSRSNDEWKYFCGCCWRRIREDQERAAAVIATEDGVGNAAALAITTRWNQEDLTYLLTLEGVQVNYASSLFECEDHNDGLCESDTLCQIASAARTRESLEQLSIRKYRKQLDAEAINDAAEEAEEVYG